jgi:hypothetical protein
MEGNTALVGRGSGTAHPFERNRSLLLTAGSRVLTTAEPLCVLPSARNGSAAQLAIRVRIKSMAPLTSHGRSGASPHQGDSPDISQHSDTPALRSPGFEDDDEDENENEAYCEALTHRAH